jgi:DNA-binding MarR family transcriptional regulator
MLALRLRIDPSGVTRLVDGLERDASVTRVRDVGDRRVVYAQLTSRGAARLLAATSTYRHSIPALLTSRFAAQDLSDLHQALRAHPTMRAAS